MGYIPQAVTDVISLQRRALEKCLVDETNGHWIWQASGADRGVYMQRRFSEHEHKPKFGKIRLKPWPQMTVTTGLGRATIHPAALFLLEEGESVDAVATIRVVNECGDKRCLNPAHNRRGVKELPPSLAKPTTPGPAALDPAVADPANIRFDEAPFLYAGQYPAFVVGAYADFRLIVYGGAGFQDVSSCHVDDLAPRPKGENP